MTALVVGTAGHIDHGKTALLRALTGIDADRLPEERRRGMTIDVGYAHLTLADGRVIDFVDVPGHDRLVGNMLVGAGEIDAAMLVVAADDGPRAQTYEHLELLDALRITQGLVAITKTDLVPADRVAHVQAEVRRLLSQSGLAGVPVVAVSSVTSEGLDDLQRGLAALATSVSVPLARASRLAIDRVFSVKGRGTVVTGTLRGQVARGDSLRVVPGGRTVRVREVQVHGETVDRSSGGRTALNLAAIDRTQLHRGLVLTTDPEVEATDRLLVALGPSTGVPELPGPGARLKVHIGTAAVGAIVGRRARELTDLVDGRRVAMLRLDRPIAAARGDRFALRHATPPSTAGGGVVVEPRPPRGPARRRLTPDRLASIASVAPDDADARLALHGIAHGRLAPDIEASLERTAMDAVGRNGPEELPATGLPASALRAQLARELRRAANVPQAEANRLVDDLIDRLVDGGKLERAGDRVGLPGSSQSPALAAAMDRLETLLSVPAPPALAEAAREAGCPPHGVRALEADGRIVRVEDDLAWARATYDELTERALSIAGGGALTPAALRDATGTSRRYVLAILEDLDRRGVLRRTPEGHVRGPRAPVRAGADC